MIRKKLYILIRNILQNNIAKRYLHVRGRRWRWSWGKKKKGKHWPEIRIYIYRLDTPTGEVTRFFFTTLSLWSHQLVVPARHVPGAWCVSSCQKFVKTSVGARCSRCNRYHSYKSQGNDNALWFSINFVLLKDILIAPPPPTRNFA